MKLCIIVPAFNEAERIGRVVRGLFEQRGKLPKFVQDFVVVVVDDGSADETGPVAKASGAIVLRHEVNRGQGAALETGNEYARRSGIDLVVHFDGDGQHNPAEIVGGIEKMYNEHLDVILGSRFLDHRSHIPWFKRYILLPISRWINFVFTGVRLTDAHNGFRILSLQALRTISITHDGMAHNSEIVAQIKACHLTFTEYPVEVVYHHYGQGIKGGVQVIYDFLFGHFIT